MTDKPIAAPAGLARRAFVTTLAGGAAAAIVAPAASLAAFVEENPDATIIGLADRILEICDQAAVIGERIRPFELERARLTETGRYASDAELSVIWENTRKYAEETGLEQGIEEMEGLMEQADSFIRTLWPIQAKTKEGRQAKVRALFHHVLPGKWLASDKDADWEIEMARKLLFEFAEMDGTDLIDA